MPNRLVSIGILVFWALASSAMLVRDVLPDLLTGPPPDLRSVIEASDPPGPVVWSILVEENPPGAAARPAEAVMRSVGQVQTETQRQLDGHTRFVSSVWFDSGSLLNGGHFTGGAAPADRLEILSYLEVDPSGNLYQFRSGVRPTGDTTELLVVEGHLEKDAILVQAHGPALRLNWRKSFPYKPREMVQNSFGPMDRIPGLHLGQRWETQMVSPLTGQVERVTAEVVRRDVLIHWGDQIVPCHELITRARGMTARTWARAGDGLVIRQEVPLLIAKLLLEREASEATGARGPSEGGKRHER